MNDKLKPSKRVIVYEEFIDGSTIVSDNGKVMFHFSFF